MRRVTAPPDEPLDVVLHIGTGKTGTSTIQAFLDQNRERLGSGGLLYPRTPGRRRHTRLGLFVQPDAALADIPSWGRQRFDSPAEFRRAFRRRLFREVNESEATRLLFSDEALYGASEPALRRLRRFADRIAASLRVVVYLRRQDDHLVSRYQQVVKVGETRRLVTRIRELDLSKTYDYYGRLQLWERTVVPSKLVVRRFEPDRFLQGSLLRDFFDASALDVDLTELQSVGRQNESLDAESVELLRIVNLYRLEDPVGSAALPSNHDLVLRLADLSRGPTLTAPTSVLDEFMSSWKESNEAVARELFDETGGTLFHGERKTANTTSEQLLEPDRLDHFLALLSLPEESHAPLRRLVEDEARQWQEMRTTTMPEKRPASRRSTRRAEELPAHYDDAAKAVIRRVRPRTMTQPEKLFGLILATRYVVDHQIPGDIVECGVWRGGSMQAAALTLLERGDTSRDLHLYDTFEGMTPPEDVDRRVDGKPAAELLETHDRDSRVWGVAGLDDVKAGMAETGYPAERVHYHPGPVEETIPAELPQGEVAILRLDTDWYASTRHELEHLYDRLSPGGVLIIDDYGYWEGSRRATEEFIARTGEQLLLIPIADGRIAVKPR